MNHLQKALERYMDVRSALGFSSRTCRSSLINFVRYLDKEQAAYVTTDLALRWATKSGDAHPSWAVDRLVMVRGFAKHLQGIDSRNEVPPLRLLPCLRSRSRPYIYTDEEIARLLTAARNLPSRNGLRGLTYATLLGLLWVTGLRISEALNLSREDVDCDANLLRVRDSKFGKSRLVPVHPTTSATLRDYARLREVAFPAPMSPSFFVTGVGTRPTHAIINMTFIRLSREVGLRGECDRRGPRLHDIRHSFAVRTLVRLYREDLDVEWHLHLLAVCLGHVGVSSLYWYLSAVPALLDLARKRLESKLGDLP